MAAYLSNIVIDDPNEILTCPAVLFGNDTVKVAAVEREDACFLTIEAPV